MSQGASSSGLIPVWTPVMQPDIKVKVHEFKGGPAISLNSQSKSGGSTKPGEKGWGYTQEPFVSLHLVLICKGWVIDKLLCQARIGVIVEKGGPHVRICHPADAQAEPCSNRLVALLVCLDST